MTEKRFTLEKQYWKGNPQGKKIFDNLTCQDEMSVEELCNIASALHLKCEELESVLEVYKGVSSKLEDENKELKDKNSQLQETLAFRSNQLALMERLVDDLGSEEMARQMEEILE